MNINAITDIPSDSRLLCLINYNAYGQIVNEKGDAIFTDVEKLEPIFAPNLAKAREILAERIGIDINALSQWEEVGEEDGFCPSLSIGYGDWDKSPCSVGYSFDIYTTVNTLHLL